MWTLGWLHYSDLASDRTRLRGRRRLSKEQRRIIARAVLFLKKDDEYIHGAALRDQTVLAKGGLWFLSLLVLAVASILVFGYPAFVVVGLVYGLWMLAHITAPIVTELFPKTRHEPVPTEPGGAVWPFATDEMLRAAPAAPVFLAGRA